MSRCLQVRKWNRNRNRRKRRIKKSWKNRVSRQYPRNSCSEILRSEGVLDWMTKSKKTGKLNEFSSVFDGISEVYNNFFTLIDSLI